MANAVPSLAKINKPKTQRDASQSSAKRRKRAPAAVAGSERDRRPHGGARATQAADGVARTCLHPSACTSVICNKAGDSLASTAVVRARGAKTRPSLLWAWLASVRRDGVRWCAGLDTRRVP